MLMIFVVALPVTQKQKSFPFTPARTAFGEHTNFSDWNLGVALPMSCFCAVWTNTGWPQPAYVTEESIDSQRTTPKAICVSYLTTAALGTIVCIVIALCIDIEAAVADET